MVRYYEPKNGVFLSLDPDPGSDGDSLDQNGYAYGKNNPVMNVDPDGHWVWLVVNAGFAAYDAYKALHCCQLIDCLLDSQCEMHIT